MSDELRKAKPEIQEAAKKGAGDMVQPTVTVHVDHPLWPAFVKHMGSEKKVTYFEWEIFLAGAQASREYEATH